MSEAVRITDACVDYGNVRAVDHVSLEVQQDTVHVLLGHSGSGKTTLLRAVAGFEPLTSGQIAVGGRVVDDGHRNGWVAPEQRKIGFVFQDYALFTHMDARKNIGFGVDKSGRDAAASVWLDRIHLPEHGGRRPGELSGGEQQRVALARAMAPQPTLVLLDEPFSNLDPHLRHAVRTETISLIRDGGATAILVTHDVEEAFSVADRITVLSAGKVVQTGTPQQLYASPATRHIARLCGPATFVQIDDVNEDGDAICVLGVVSTSSPPAAGGTLVVRPEHLVVEAGGDFEVRRRTFLGATEELELTRTGLAELLIARPPAGSVVGDKVTVKVRGTCAVL